MSEIKKLYDISWQVSEADYRVDDALSYSTIARFAREGFNKLDTLFDRVDTPSLTFGSAVDALITGGQEEFDKTFLVADIPPLTESVLKMVKAAFDKYNGQYRQLSDIPTTALVALSEELNYQLNWKPETRAKVVKEQGSEYYSLMYAAGDRKILDTQTKELVDGAVSALKNSSATKFYFAPNNPFNKAIVREYQLKFKATLEGVNYRCMPDLLIVDHDNKVVYPIDLKTSSHTEWDFYQSFIQWRYDIQARLYWRIIRDNMDRDPLYKEYRLANYRFIVVNKKTLTPLVWNFEDTQKKGTLTYGKNKVELNDPYDLGKELANYLSSRPAVPNGINLLKGNSITEWLNKTN
jgi:hypothetical protein